MPGALKLVHAADLHLDSPLRGLERYEGAPMERIREASRRALENLVDLCLDERVHALLLAGDLYDGDWRDYSTGLFFHKEMARLHEGGVRVFFIRGNHDAASRIAKQLQPPDNVTELSTRRPQTVRDDHLGLAVHGQGFPKRDVTHDLASAYPEPVPGLLNVGMLHTALTGRPGHEPYAPCHVETLQSKGYDYWALGHVHRHEIISDDPWIVFSGNLQGRHARETGPKGAVLVTADDGRVVAVEHRALDVVRWARVDIDLGNVSGAEEAVEAVRAELDREAAAAEGRLVAARVILTGTTPAHDALQRDAERWKSEIRAQALDIGGGEVWVEKVAFRTQPPIDVDALAQRRDAVGQLVRALRDTREDDESLRELGEMFADLRRKLPPEARDGENGVRLDDPAYLREALEDVERILLPRLLESSER